MLSHVLSPAESIAELRKVIRWGKEQERKRFDSQSAAIARMLAGSVLNRAAPRGGAMYPLLDHMVYVGKDRRPFATISHSYIKPALSQYELADELVARKLTLESGWNPEGCVVYVVMHRDREEWAGLAEVLA